MYKRISALILLVAFGVSFCISVAYAAQQENKVTKFFKKLFNWPVNVTKEGAQTVGETTEKSLTTVSKTASSAVETVTGKPEKIKDVIMEPVQGTAETATTAIKGTVETPIEGTKETFKEEVSQ